MKLEPTALVLPLFSNPARRVPAGMTAIRASLHDLIGNAPAAWASLEVHLGNDPLVLAKGFADANGQLQVLMPYPKLPDQINPSALGQHSWLLKIRVAYTPVQDTTSLNAQKIPDLYHLFTQTLTQDFIEQNLEFGHELILKSSGSSSLNITPA
jgi:hypothetical protein